MPLYEYECADCGKSCEILLTRTRETPQCPHCGGSELNRLLSATSTLTGQPHHPLPGPRDTGCCGAHPQHAGCAGPGSCCGKTG